MEYWVFSSFPLASSSSDLASLFWGPNEIVCKQALCMSFYGIQCYDSSFNLPQCSQQLIKEPFNRDFLGELMQKISFWIFLRASWPEAQEARGLLRKTKSICIHIHSLAEVFKVGNSWPRLTLFRWSSAILKLWLFVLTIVKKAVSWKFIWNVQHKGSDRREQVSEYDLGLQRELTWLLKWCLYPNPTNSRIHRNILLPTGTSIPYSSRL